MATRCSRGLGYALRASRKENHRGHILYYYIYSSALIRRLIVA